MSTANHLTIRDYFDQVFTGKQRTRKVFPLSPERANASGTGMFHRLLASRQMQGVGKANVKSTGLTIVESLANPLGVKGRYQRSPELLSPEAKADRSPGRQVLAATKASLGKDTASSLSEAKPVPSLCRSVAMPAKKQSDFRVHYKIKNSIQKEASKYNEEFLRETKTKTELNNKSTVVREVISEIEKEVEVVDTYSAESVETEDITELNYWELPDIPDDQAWNAFDISDFRCKEPYNFAALLGANAVSSIDGSFFFVQHFRNITNMMQFANKTILVISIEKIVKDYEQALFISRATGFFGLKSVLLGILSNATKYKKISMDQMDAEFKKESGSNAIDTHVILLDNGRKDMCRGEFKEFLQCINCRACGSVCPRSLFGYEEEYRTPRELVLMHFTRGLKETINQGLYNCSLCGGCEIVCPLSIPLPDFLLKIREQAFVNCLMPKKHLKLGENIKNFGNPYGKGD